MHRQQERYNPQSGRRLEHKTQAHIVQEDSTWEESMKTSEMFKAAMMSMDINNHDTASWYLDSGATKHVTGDPSKMYELKTVEDSNVRLAGGTSHSVLGKRNELFKSDGQVNRISNVLYVSGVTKNLLSIGSITDQGCIVTFGPTVSNRERFGSIKNHRTRK
uniref:Retrovirus-related Pol polyprotein from transposon TNT 1-94-like beta-barrel domain-containing protein n=1 Tax=Physcomitrium patens TaxID=3218 RepID=A0A2K1ID03_PHYPA|nr:hypothetical protein PHYPA_030628 [Physcomitrium patens]